jgi:RimJ/RimL family protein N-acetyltransferase
MGELGFREALICVESNNQASRRGIEKAGFHLRGRIYRRRLLGFGWRRDEKEQTETC